MSVDPMLRDDVEQWSRVEDEQEWPEYRVLWNAEQHRRRITDCSPPYTTCCVRPLRNDQIQSSLKKDNSFLIMFRYEKIIWNGDVF